MDEPKRLTPIEALRAAMPETASPLDEKRQMLESHVIEVLRTVYDPEIPVNIYELGMIYKVAAEPDKGEVNVTMTLTSPMCPVAGTLPGEVQQKIETVEGVTSAKVELVWEPPWTPAMMTDAAKLQLGMEF